MSFPHTNEICYPLLKWGFTSDTVNQFTELLLDWFSSLSWMPLSGERAVWLQENRALKRYASRGEKAVPSRLDGNPPCICWNTFVIGSIHTGSIDKKHCRGCLGSKSAVILALPIIAEDTTRGVISLGLREPLVYENTERIAFFSELISVIGTTIAAVSQREELIADRIRYTTLLNTLSDGVIQIDRDGTMMSVNDAAARMFGYDPDELVNRPVSMLIAEPYRGCYGDCLRNSLNTGIDHPLAAEREMDGARHKDGSVFPVGLRVTETRIRQAPTYLALIRDLTQRKEVERQLREARDQALEASRIKSEFLANMSHEIRTPMTGVIGMTEILLESGLTEIQRDYALTIQQSAASLLTIINDILDFSKIEAGKLQINEVSFNLMTVLEDVVDLFSEMARSRQIEIGLLMDSHITLEVVGDPVRVRQILTNLVGNAVKFTEKGDVLIRVTIEAETAETQKLRFSVSDTGVGIAAEQQRLLFQSFTQINGAPNRKHGGTGLGLAISKKLVEMMGGEIGMESTLGVGSTFWFSLPLQKRSDPFDWEGDLHANENIAQSTRCLIVDANATSRKILDHYLTNWNIPHQAAADSASALEMLQDAALTGTPFNLVLLDLAMPQTDGLMLAERIQRNDRFGRPKMILLSSLGGHVDPNALRDAGLDGFLTKPVRQSKLFDTMMTVLSGKAQKVASSLDSYLLQKKPAQPEAIAADASERYRILLVEDNLVNQKTAYILLKKLGYDVDLAENGRQAIVKVMENLYDLVLMDVQMPEMDGLESTRRIRQLEGGICHTPIVAMTAHAMIGDREKCLEAGMDDYLSKPINREALANVLQKWLCARKPIEQPPPL